MTKAEIWKASDTTTRKAIRGSVRKWVKVVEGRGRDHGTDNCPLCRAFREIAYYCEGCPVSVFAGMTTCEGTPQEDWAVHSCERCRLQSPTGGAFPACCESLKLAKAELRFLAGFLPAREKLHAKVKAALSAKLKDTRRRVRALGKLS